MDHAHIHARMARLWSEQATDAQIADTVRAMLNRLRAPYATATATESAAGEGLVNALAAHLLWGDAIEAALANIALERVRSLDPVDWKTIERRQHSNFRWAMESAADALNPGGETPRRTNSPSTIKAIRERLNLTQSALAEGIGCTQGNVGHYERGQTVLPDVAKRLIAFAAGRGMALTFDHIYGEEPLPEVGENPATEPEAKAA